MRARRPSTIRRTTGCRCSRCLPSQNSPERSKGAASRLRSYGSRRLPNHSRRSWVRGYGLIDSPKTKATPGKVLNLTAAIAPNARAAAEYYPANYWLSLLKVPAESEFAGAVEGRGFTTEELRVSPPAKPQQEILGTGVRSDRFAEDESDARKGAEPHRGHCPECARGGRVLSGELLAVVAQGACRVRIRRSGRRARLHD